MKVLYVTSGHQLYPHRYLDQFIIAALNSHQTQQQIRIFELNINTDWSAKLLALVEEYRPHFVFTIHGSNMTPHIVQRMRHLGAKVGVWFVDDPYDVDASKNKLFGYDYVFTTEPNCVPYYNRLGVSKAFYVGFGTATGYYFPQAQPAHYQSDLCIVGSPFSGRVEVVKRILATFPHVKFKLVGPFWLRYFNSGAQIYNAAVDPNEARRYYNGAKINLNFHRMPNEQLNTTQNLNLEGIKSSTPNVRTFDIAACQGFQLVDYKANLRGYFDLTNELITFTDVTELLRRIDYYLHHPEERTNIARNAYKKTVQKYRLEGFIANLFTVVEREMDLERNLLKSPEVKKAGYLVKGDQKPAVFFVLNGIKHEFPSQEVFHKLSFRWEDVKLVPQHQVDSLATGVAIKL